jgi:hypothetical protein
MLHPSSVNRVVFFSFCDLVPLPQLNSEDGDDIAVKLFNSLLIFAGLLTTGGFEVPDDAGFVLLVQNVLGRCLEREELAAELFLQLIRQTTDHPEPNGRINVQNWRFMALSASVLAPANKVRLTANTGRVSRSAFDSPPCLLSF